MSNEQPKTNKDVITLRVALELTGFSRATFYRRIERNVIKPLPMPLGLKKRAVTKFLRADVLKLIED